MVHGIRIAISLQYTLTPATHPALCIPATRRGHATWHINTYKRRVQSTDSLPVAIAYTLYPYYGETCPYRYNITL